MKHFWVYVFTALIISTLISVGAYFTYGMKEAIIIFMTSFFIGGGFGIGAIIIIMKISNLE